jgi:hypothetical protein
MIAAIVAPMFGFEQIADAATWTRLAPDLHVGDDAFLLAVPPLALGDNHRADLMEQLRFDGYFHESDVGWALDAGRMAGIVRHLGELGIAPVFAFVFDEFWLPFRRLSAWYRGLLGDYAMMPNFWAWNLDPRRGDAGWPPHRDNGPGALLPDGGPKSLTTWIPLSDATPLNGCMYIVPASFDPVYGTADKSIRFTLPSVRALPAKAGDLLMWNQAVMHWGGRTSPRAAQSRVSIAFEFQRRDAPPFAGPLLDPEAIPSFEERLWLIGRQILQYRHMYRTDAATQDAAQRMVAAFGGAR